MLNPTAQATPSGHWLGLAGEDNDYVKATDGSVSLGSRIPRFCGVPRRRSVQPGTEVISLHTAACVLITAQGIKSYF